MNSNLVPYIIMQEVQKFPTVTSWKLLNNKNFFSFFSEMNGLIFFISRLPHLIHKKKSEGIFHKFEKPALIAVH